MSGANREYVDRKCLHDEVCIYREEHMRKGAERMNKSRVTEYGGALYTNSEEAPCIFTVIFFTFSGSSKLFSSPFSPLRSVTV